MPDTRSEEDITKQVAAIALETCRRAAKNGQTLACMACFIRSQKALLEADIWLATVLRDHYLRGKRSA